MEQMNQVELRGNVGTVKYIGPKDKPMAIFSLATNKAYISSDGSSIVETTWHNIVAYEGKDIKCVDQVEKGKKVYVRGRIRNQKFTSSDGTEHYSYDIFANKMLILDEAEALTAES